MPLWHLFCNMHKHCGRQNKCLPHSDAHILTPRTRKRMTKGMGSWGCGPSGRDNGPDYGRQPSNSPQSLKVTRGGRKSRDPECNDRSRPQSEAVTGFEDGGRGQEPRNAGDHWKWKRLSNRFSPRAFRKQQSPQRHVDFSSIWPKLGLLISQTVCCYCWLKPLC